MTRLEKSVNLAAVVIPFLAVLAAIPLLWNRLVSSADLAILGSMAVQGPVIAWVADHRKHHAHTDVDGDPHSPHVGHGDGVKGVFSGLWYAHVGWLLVDQGRAERRRFAPELCEDRGMRTLNRWFPLLVVYGLAIPALAGYLVSGSIVGAATGLLWGGLVRVF